MMNTALKNMRRSPYQAFAAMVIVSLTLFIVGVFSLVVIGSQQILLNFETKPQIIAYLKDGHSPDQVTAALSLLTSTQGVKKAIYISKKDALEIYKKSVGNDPMLLGTVTDWGIVTSDILPASIEITAQNPEAFKLIESVLQKTDIVNTTPQGRKEIDFPQDVIAELSKWTTAIRAAGAVLVLALSLVSVLTIMIIISMKIASRRTEISTLKLIGAKNFYIIKPYVQESTIYGIGGAVFGWLAVYISLLYATPFLSPRLGNIISFPIPFEVFLILLAFMVVFGYVLSLISGFLAAIRFVNRSK